MPVATCRPYSNAVSAFFLTAIAIISSAPAAGSEKVLHAFQGGSDGATPVSGLIADPDGNLYGTTADGGTGSNCGAKRSSCGTVFKIASNGTETVLHSFTGGSDGDGPVGGVVMDKAGNLYGTTWYGGTTHDVPHRSCGGHGCGVVFKLAPDGTETILHAFRAGSGGWYPNGGLTADASGNLYGETMDGGKYNNSICAQFGCGTVFEIQPDGSKITLYAFQGGTDGASPLDGVTADAAGNLYGVTSLGGAPGCGCGTVYKVTPQGAESALYAFQGGLDGVSPNSGLIVDNAGNLYGTTSYGGQFGAGTVFKITPDGTEILLYSFQGTADGASPAAALIMDDQENLYGTTIGGGDPHCDHYGCGTVFGVTPEGKETVLYAFPKKGRGEGPHAQLLRMNGNFYGTTTYGGKSNDGVVFELKK